ncbi:MAG: LysE family translocator [Puniceicoccaceae bacterium]
MELILSVAVIHLLACLSPGPDILLVVLNSIRQGWRAGVETTFGILSGVTIQITLGITGITYLVSRNASLQSLTALAGGAWLAYLGGRGLWSKWRSIRSAAVTDDQNLPGVELEDSTRSYWMQGFLVNILNPKALLYFLSLFSVLLGQNIPLQLKFACGFTMLLVQAVAFSTVAISLHRLRAGRQWTRMQGWLDPVISLILLILGLWIWIRTGLLWSK